MAAIRAGLIRYYIHCRTGYNVSGLENAKIRCEIMNRHTSAIFFSLIFTISILASVPRQASAFFQQEDEQKLLLKAQTSLHEQMHFDPEYQRLIQLVRHDRSNTAALADLGMTLIQYDYVDSAETVFNTLFRLDSDNAVGRDGMGLVYFRKGRSAIILYESLKRALGRDNYSKAVAEFRQALQIDPEMHIARYHMAETYLARDGGGDHERAVETMNELIRLEPGFPGAHYLLGRIYYEMEDYPQAERELLEQISIDPGHGPANIYLAYTYFHIDKYQKVTDLYMTGLENLKDVTILEDIYIHMAPIFNKDENNEYFQRTLNDRGGYIAEFWRKKDPNVLTRDNERLIEHLERLDHVRNIYSQKNFRGYDDRGLIYLKYGEPDVKRTDFGRGENVNDNESWLYSSISKYLAFDFVSNGGIYRLVPNLSYASHPPSAAVARRLYNERIDLGGIYAEIGGKASIASEQFLSDLSLFNIYKDEAVAKAPAENLKYSVSAIPIHFPMNLTQFIGSNGKTAVEVYYGIPLDQLDFAGIETGYKSNVLTHMVILDTNYVRLDEMNRTKTINLRSMDEITSRFSIGSEYLELDPGSYLFGFELKQQNPPRLGLYQFNLPVRDFSSTDLMISDLRASSESDQFRVVPIASREELSLNPYPFSSINRQLQLLLYFEVYNLSYGPDDRTSYKVEYSIRNQDEDAGMLKRIGRFLLRRKGEEVAVTQERSGKDNAAYELVSMDVHSINASDALITVSVTDMITGEKVTTTRRVHIVN